MLLSITHKDVIDLILRDENYVVFKSKTVNDNSIAYRKEDLIKSKGIIFNGAFIDYYNRDRRLGGDVLQYLNSPVKSPVYIEYNIDKYRLSGSVNYGKGAYGYVYGHKTHDFVVKNFTDTYSFLIEAAAFELIQTAYGNNRENGCNLPTLLGIYDHQICLPKYNREINIREDDSVHKQLARGIYDLHQLGIVHRDIKHHNVMASNSKVVLLDFGISSWLPFNCNRSRSTSIQTMYYRAPEIAFGEYEDKYTLKIDDWSFGIILAANKLNKMLYVPDTTSELKQHLKWLYDSTSNNIHTKNLKPVKDYGDANNFLISSPEKRKSVAEYLKLPAITNESMLKKLPISTSVKHLKIKTVLSLAGYCKNIFSYFAAMDYISYLDNINTADIESAAGISNVLFYGDYSVSEKIYGFLTKINFQLYRLNTYFILTLLYPSRVSDFSLSCFMSSINGNRFPHMYQADFISRLIFQKPLTDDKYVRKITNYYSKITEKGMSDKILKIYGVLIKPLR